MASSDTSPSSASPSSSSSSSSSSSPAFEYAPNALARLGATVWHEFTPLAQKHQAVNLGQGFPSFEGPKFVHDAAKCAIDAGLNQYARSAGHPRLVNAIARLYSPLFGRDIDAMREVCVTNGASQGIFAAIHGLCTPGDEAVLIEPFFDIYIGGLMMAGVTPRYVAMDAHSDARTSGEAFTLDVDKLEAAITERTRILLLNNPHNPTGKAYTRAELEAIAAVVRRHPRLMVVADEVYEWMYYDGVRHERFATLPGMWERTVTVSSAGKTFCVTGWKIGWCVGPPALVHGIACAHQFIPFSVATPLSEAIGVALERMAESEEFVRDFRANYTRKRDLLLDGLRAAGLDPIVPQATFFIMARTSHLHVDAAEASACSLTGLALDARDWNVCRMLTTRIGVTAIPPSPFFSAEHATQPLAVDYVRFAFCKTDDELREACDRLKKLKDVDEKK